jgi:hypothetical protein
LTFIQFNRYIFSQINSALILQSFSLNLPKVSGKKFNKVTKHLVFFEPDEKQLKKSPENCQKVIKSEKKSWLPSEKNFREK